MYPQRDSNPQPSHFEYDASANWARGAYRSAAHRGCRYLRPGSDPERSELNGAALLVPREGLEPPTF